MNYYGIELGYISGGFGEHFETTHKFYFSSKTKRDAFYKALGGENGNGYGGMDTTTQQTFPHKNSWGYDSYADHMRKIDPRKPPKLYDDFDLSKIKLERPEPPHETLSLGRGLIGAIIDEISTMFTDILNDETEETSENETEKDH